MHTKFNKKPYASYINDFASFNLMTLGITRIVFKAVAVEEHQVLFIGRAVPALRRLPVPYEMADLRGKKRPELFHKENTSSASGKASMLNAHSFKCTKSALR